MTEVVNIKTGARYDFYIGRRNKSYKLPESPWNNPYVIGKDGNRDEVIAKYKARLWQQMNGPNAAYIRGKLLELDGKVLGCWCKPEPCHGDVLVAAIEWLKKAK
jgi:hypothetical protein